MAKRTPRPKRAPKDLTPYDLRRIRRELKDLEVRVKNIERWRLIPLE